MHGSNNSAPPALRRNGHTARCGLFAALASSVLVSQVCGQAAIEGTVPLPDAPNTAVMSQRYAIVSRSGVLSVDPPMAVVWIEGDFPPSASLPTKQVVQKGFNFDPTVLPVQVGTKVEFPNEDGEYHNVFSYSRPKRFDLGRYMPDERPVPAQVFDQPGLVTLRCDIHQHMRAIILVVRSPHFTKSDSSGAYRLDGLPAGEFVVKAWVDSKTTLEQRVVLADGETLIVDF